MIKFKHSGNFNNTERFFSRAKKMQVLGILNRYGKNGVSALAKGTPVDTGLTASSWDYEVSLTGKGYTIMWTNTVMAGGVPLVILLQYGHGTGNGGYVVGRDFINPAIKPIFEALADDLFAEVSKL
jgi:hypothetical protein